MPPERKAELEQKAKETYERLKKEAEEEIEAILRKRAEAGIANDGDAVTERDLEEIQGF